MAISIGLFLAGFAGWFCWMKRSELLSVKAELQRTIASAESELKVQQFEHEAAVEKLKSRISDLDSECDRLSVENRMRREYAYVCDECKTHSPAVREMRDRSLRSVTSGPKR